MPFTKEIQDKLRAAVPCVEFDEIQLYLAKDETAISFLLGGKVVATRPAGAVHNGDTCKLTGFSGRLPVDIRFED